MLRKICYTFHFWVKWKTATILKQLLLRNVFQVTSELSNPMGRTYFKQTHETKGTFTSWWNSNCIFDYFSITYHKDIFLNTFPSWYLNNSKKLQALIFRNFLIGLKALPPKGGSPFLILYCTCLCLRLASLQIFVLYVRYLSLQ